MIEVVLVPILGFIFYQDIKSRKVNVWVICALFLLSLWHGWNSLALHDFTLRLLLNNLFILFQLIILYGYLIIRYRKLKLHLLQFLGLGDILFWIAITPLFAFPEFLIFFVISILLSLVIFIGYRVVSKDNKILIPLAGFQSLVLIFFIFFRIFTL